MEEMLQHISRIQDKLQGLQKQFQQINRDKDRLLQEVQVHVEKSQVQQGRIEQLEKQLEINRAIRPEMTAQDKTALEKRINQYLREIDKCIALLNE